MCRDPRLCVFVATIVSYFIHDLIHVLLVFATTMDAPGKAKKMLLQGQRIFLLRFTTASVATGVASRRGWGVTSKQVLRVELVGGRRNIQLNRAVMDARIERLRSDRPKFERVDRRLSSPIEYWVANSTYIFLDLSTHMPRRDSQICRLFKWFF